MDLKICVSMGLVQIIGILSGVLSGSSGVSRVLYIIDKL